jgi:acetoin utilization deacetylase AcuC-like enzyme
MAVLLDRAGLETCPPRRRKCRTRFQSRPALIANYKPVDRADVEIRPPMGVLGCGTINPMKVFYTDTFTFPLPENHRFPRRKYALLRQRVEESGLISPEDLQIPDPATDEELLRIHTPDYLHRVKEGLLTDKELRRIGLPWSPELVQRSYRSVGGTLAACRAAFEDGVAVSLSGGTHHAHADRGAGYCIFNDAAVAARVMQAEGRVERVVILDCDVHQGDGTASIFAQDPTVFTFSIHGDKNYPFHKPPSDLDIALPDGTGDDAYCEALELGVEQALEAAYADLAIYLAGADPYKDDLFGRLSLTKDGLLARDRIVLEACRGREIPTVVVMSGGYVKNVDDVAEIHFNTVQLIAKQTP